MSKRKKKKSKATKIEWHHILIQAAIDFSIGVLVAVVDRLMN